MALRKREPSFLPPMESSSASQLSVHRGKEIPMLKFPFAGFDEEIIPMYVWIKVCMVHVGSVVLGDSLKKCYERP
jgi:hypothetical protein